jgi:hypothetical protein
VNGGGTGLPSFSRPSVFANEEEVVVVSSSAGGGDSSPRCLLTVGVSLHLDYCVTTVLLHATTSSPRLLHGTTP